MELIINKATMEHGEEGYLGRVTFTVAGHRAAYEIVLQSKKGKDWGYSLNFLAESGKDVEIEAVGAYLEENEDAFDQLIEAAMQELDSAGE